MLRFFSLISKNAMRNRRRSILTICSVGASLCLLGVLMAIYHAFFFTPPTPEQERRLWTRNRISLANIMPIAYRDKILRVPGVQDTMVMQWFGGVYKEPKNMFSRFGVEPERYLRIMPEYKLTPEEQKAFVSERTACIIGKDVALKYNLKHGDHMILEGDIFAVNLDFVVRGIYDFPTDNESMFFHLQYLFESMPPRARDIAGMFVSLIDDPANSSRISKDIDETFRNSSDQTRTETEKHFSSALFPCWGMSKSS